MSPDRQEPRGPKSLESFETVSQMATDTLLKHGSHYPMLLLDGSRENALHLLAGFAQAESGTERQMQMFALGRQSATTNDWGDLRQAFFMMEAWFSDRSQNPSVRPSEDPNKREGLLVESYNFQTDQYNIALFEIIRTGLDQVDLLDITEEQTKGEPVTEENSPTLAAFVKGYSKRKPRRWFRR